MYREWLAKKLETARRGTKARLAEHLGLNADVVSKMLSGVRDITAEELRKIAEFFDAMPPGFEKVTGGTGIIQTEEEILAFLGRIDGLSDYDIDLAFGVIRNALAARRAGQAPSADRDRQSPASRHREPTPS